MSKAGPGFEKTLAGLGASLPSKSGGKLWRGPEPRRAVSAHCCTHERGLAQNMLNPFRPPELIKAETFVSLPGKFRNKGRTTWSDHNRQGAEVDSFLEGP